MQIPTRTLTALGLVLLLASPAVAGDPGTVTLDDLALGHPLPLLGGGSTSLAGELGAPLLVNFWATWCKPCEKEMPFLEALDVRLRAAGGRVLAVSIDRDAGKLRRHVDRLDLGLTICHDGPDGLVRRLDPGSIPYTLLLDESGRVVHTMVGTGPEQLADLDAAVSGLLAGIGDRADTQREESR